MTERMLRGAVGIGNTSRNRWRCRVCQHLLSRFVPFAFVLVALPTDALSLQRSDTDPALTLQRDGKVSRGCGGQPNDQSIDVAHIEFNDEGTFARPGQLKIALDCIAHARNTNPNGAVVVLFVHGWHHNAAWNPSTDMGDEHFAQFRRILMSLALREAERYGSGGVPAGRRVVGLYLGWNGDPRSGFYAVITKYVHTNTSFYDRYGVAKTIASGQAIRQTLRGVVETAKSGPGPDSPLALIGHSMGGMIVEIALTAIVEEKGAVGAPRAMSSVSCFHVERNGQPIVFPDLVLLLNSAAGSEMSMSLMRLLDKEQIRKTVACDGKTFLAPLIISATSEGDTDTRDWFPRAYPGRATAGHTPKLLTHRVIRDTIGARCSPRPLHHLANDYQQSWHCLRSPTIADDAVTEIAVDLPQSNDPGSDCHVRYRLMRIPTNPSTSPYWIFQIPSTLVANHNDIFNGTSNLFVMALMQLSGSIMSLAQRWPDVFEPAEGPC
jgi:hypothetical protein